MGGMAIGGGAGHDIGMEVGKIFLPLPSSSL